MAANDAAAVAARLGVRPDAAQGPVRIALHSTEPVGLTVRDVAIAFTLRCLWSRRPSPAPTSANLQ